MTDHFDPDAPPTDEAEVPTFPGLDVLGAWDVPEPAPDLTDRVLDHVETAMNTMTDVPMPETSSMPARRGGLGLALVGVAMVAAAGLVLGLTQWWRAPARVEPSPAAVIAPDTKGDAAAADGAALVVRTIPRDARATIDGKPIAGPSPFAVSSLPPGSHRLEVEREGYLPFSRVIESGAPLQLPVELQLRDVVLVLTVDPPEASVTLWAGDESSEIGGDGTRHALRREPGVKYELEASAPGYRSRRVPLSLGRDADVPVSLSLVVDPEAEVPEVAAGSEVEEPRTPFRGSSSGGSPDLKDPFKRPGRATRPLSKPKSEPKPKTTHSEPLEDPFAKTATLRVAPKSGGPVAKVYIDGKFIGHTPLLNIRLKPGRHRIEMDFGDGTTWKKTFTLKANETRTIKPD